MRRLFLSVLFIAAGEFLIPVPGASEMVHGSKTPVLGPVSGIPDLTFGASIYFQQGAKERGGFGKPCWPLIYKGKRIGWLWEYFTIGLKAFGFQCIENVTAKDITPCPGCMWGGFYPFEINEIDFGEVRPTLRNLKLPGWAWNSEPSLHGRLLAYWGEDGRRYASVYDLITHQLIRHRAVGPQSEIAEADLSDVPPPRWDADGKRVTFPAYGDYESAIFTFE